MGLCCTHDAFDGSYGSFNRLRQAVCHATGGSFPPDWVFMSDGEPKRGPDGRELLNAAFSADRFHCGDGYTPEKYPGLFAFLDHSDCDGEISPDMCAKVADDLESLLPKVEALGWTSREWLTQYDGSFVRAVRQFIAGCRAAAAADEPLDFC